MKLLCTLDNRIEAEILKSKLEAHGISAYIQSDDLGQMRPIAKIIMVDV